MLDSPSVYRIAEGSWTALCVTLMYACLYYIAYKELRLWLTVKSVLQDREPCAEDGLTTTAKPPLSPPPLSLSAPKLLKHITITSVASPCLIWLWRIYTLGAGYLDIFAIGLSSVCLFTSITCVLALPNTKIAIKTIPITKVSPQGWILVPTSSREETVAAVYKSSTFTIPLTSVLICFWMLFGGESTITTASPLKPLADAVFVAMLCLAPIAGVRFLRAKDLRMKHVLMLYAGALAFLVVLGIFILVLVNTTSNDATPPAEATDDGFFIQGLERAMTWVFTELAIHFRTVQLGGVVFVPLFAVLRFEYEQAVGSNQGEYTLLDNVPVSESPADNDALAEQYEEEKPNVLDKSTDVQRTANDHDAAQHATIPAFLPPFSSPIFLSTLSGAYVSSLLVALFLPNPNLWDLVVCAAFLGSVVGLCVGLTVKRQWRNLWAYEEIWTARVEEKQVEQV